MNPIKIGPSAPRIGGGGETARFYGGTINSNTANLFIFIPVQHVPQVLRPYQYTFTEDMAQTMLTPQGNSYLKNLEKAPQAFKTAITPSSTGINIDTYLYSTYWSFLLIVQEVQKSPSILMAGGPSSRTIYCGYFLDEPMSPHYIHMEGSSNIPLNENARMMITHVDGVTCSTTSGQNGVNNSIRMAGSSDIMHQAMAQFSPENLAFCDFSSIVESNDHIRHAGALAGNGNPQFIGDFHAHGKAVPDVLRSPKRQLLDMAHSVQAGSNAVGEIEIISEASPEMGGYDAFEQVMATMLGNMQSVNSQVIYKHFDPSVPVPLGHLQRIFPFLTTVPIKNTDYNIKHEIEDPTVLSVENVVSSMISNVVSNYARASMLAAISFRYNSWGNGVESIRPGVWEILGASPMIVHQNGDSLNQQVSSFMFLLETGLFPIIRAYAGGTDFDLMVGYDGTYNTSICLNYMDNGVKRTAFITNHNRMGGNLSPVLGTYGHLESNKNQITGLLNQGMDTIMSAHNPNVVFGNGTMIGPGEFEYPDFDSADEELMLPAL